MLEKIKERTAISMWVSLLGLCWKSIDTRTGAMTALTVASLVANIICHLGGVF